MPKRSAGMFGGDMPALRLGMPPVDAEKLHRQDAGATLYTLGTAHCTHRGGAKWGEQEFSQATRWLSSRTSLSI